MLTRVAQDAERALQAVEQSRELGKDDGVVAARDLLRDLIGQDFDVDQDGVPRLHVGTRQGRIISTVDPEMRHGRKSSSQRFDGYKLHATSTGGETPLITAIEITAASEQDGPQAPTLVDQQPAHRRPRRLLGDTAYGTGPVRSDLAERHVDVLAPVPEAPVAEGRLGKRDFAIDLDAATVTCPAGHTASIATTPRGDRRALFRVTCRDCLLRPRCLGSNAYKKIEILPDEALLATARRALDDHATAEHLRRTRPRIERLLGLLTHRYQARQSRYIGSKKSRLQAAWTAALVNLNPIGRRLALTTE
jgi:hypothetical protein